MLLQPAGFEDFLEAEERALNFVLGTLFADES